jgi:hypothetical protein
MLLASVDYKLLLGDELIKLCEHALSQGGVITSVWRNVKLQEVYYAQGRKATSEVNELRKALGLREISAKENKIITATIRSKHLILLAVDIWFKANRSSPGVVYKSFFDGLDDEIKRRVYWGGVWHSLKDYMHFEYVLNNRSKLEKMYNLAFSVRVENQDDLLEYREKLMRILKDT